MKRYLSLAVLAAPASAEPPPPRLLRPEAMAGGLVSLKEPLDLLVARGVVEGIGAGGGPDPAFAAGAAIFADGGFDQVVAVFVAQAGELAFGGVAVGNADKGVRGVDGEPLHTLHTPQTLLSPRDRSRERGLSKPANPAPADFINTNPFPLIRLFPAHGPHSLRDESNRSQRESVRTRHPRCPLLQDRPRRQHRSGPKRPVRLQPHRVLKPCRHLLKREILRREQSGESNEDERSELQ